MGTIKGGYYIPSRQELNDLIDKNSLAVVSQTAIKKQQELEALEEENRKYYRSLPKFFEYRPNGRLLPENVRSKLRNRRFK